MQQSSEKLEAAFKEIETDADEIEIDLEIEKRTRIFSKVQLKFIKERRKAAELTIDGDFLHMLHVLANLLTELQGGSIHLYDVVGLIRPPNFDEFRIYLQ
jgi:hypothetical protein